MMTLAEAGKASVKVGRSKGSFLKAPSTELPRHSSAVLAIQSMIHTYKCN
jgi:hypothetical protein